MLSMCFAFRTQWTPTDPNCWGGKPPFRVMQEFLLIPGEINLTRNFRREVPKIRHRSEKRDKRHTNLLNCAHTLSRTGLLVHERTPAVAN